METPSSTATRVVTRSQTSTLVASNNPIISNNTSRKIEESEKNISKSRQRNQQQQQDRGALIDISNDSPIVGLANGDVETPLSCSSKLRGSRVKKTPGSGEALLRGQVKTLLQKVEEEADFSKIAAEIRPFLKFANSPMTLLAPTPANTPQVPDFNNSTMGLASVSPSSVIQEQLISQVVNQILEGKNEESPESEKNLITRSLLLDFSDKSDVSDCSSEVTYQGVITSTEEKKAQNSTEDDGDSIWSMQVNASTHDEDEDEEIAEVEEEEEDDYYEDGEEEEEYGENALLDELCAGLVSISVNERVVPKFSGKHTRFVYNSDEEIVEEVEVVMSESDDSSESVLHTRFVYNNDEEIVEEVEVVMSESADSSESVLHLKGLPTPKGKHFRFSEEEEEKSA